MLDRIIAFSLRNRFLVAAVALFIGVYGTLVALRLPVDVLPDLNRPTVTILTEAHGLVPVDVERLVTIPIERSVSGVTGVTRVRSSSGNGLSVVWVEFDWNSEIYRNRQLVQERLQIARSRLIEEAIPVIAPVASIMGQVQLIGVYCADGSVPIDALRSLVDQYLRPQLLAVPGVAQVTVSGGAPRQLQVILDGDKLRALRVPVQAVAEAVRRANHNAGGGVLEMGSMGPLVNVTGALTAGAALAEAVVVPDPQRPVRIADVAQIEFGPAAVRTGDAGINGGDGIIVTIQKQPGIDTVALTAAVERELERIGPSLPAGVTVDPFLFRQADFIQRGIDNVTEAIRDGAILVVLVLLLFLLNIRTTLITLTAIPLSVAVTALVFQAFGVSINTMTLGGLAVAVGALVDDAIVDVENVFRRLRQNTGKASPLAALTVVFRASSEVRQPILVGTLVVAVVYIPLFALSGMEGRLFTPLGVSYIVSILASLLVSITLTPVLCSWLLPTSKALRREGDTFAVRHLHAAAGTVIGWGLARPVWWTTFFGGLVLVCLGLLGTRGTEFLPAFNEGTAQVGITLPPGASLATSSHYGRILEETAGSVAGIRSVARRTGRAEEDEHAHGVHVSEIIITFDPDADAGREEMLDELRDRLGERLPGLTIQVEQPLAHLLSHLLSGVPAQVAIKVQGQDLTILRSLGHRIGSAVGGIPGVVGLKVEAQTLVEQVEVSPNRPALARFGLDVQDIAATVELSLEGERVSTLKVGALSYPIVLRLRAEDRRNLEDLRALPVYRDGNVVARIADVAHVRLTRTATNVNRENGLRRFVVSHDISGRALGDVVADVERALEPIRASLPQGYTIAVSGQFEAQQEASRVMFLLSFLSLFAMGGLIFSHFRSLQLTLQTLVNIPTAFIGAVLFVLATGQTLSVATLVGLISLGGIAVRNKILLLDHYLHLMVDEGETCTPDMIVRAGKERIVPVLMTALTSGIALVPLVLSPGEPGREILFPVASVIVGGLVTTTLLDVLLSPGLFWLFGRGAAERVAMERRDALEQEPSPI